VSTDAYGYFEFWVDDSEYVPSQRFKIVLSHANFESKTYDDIKIIPDEPYIYYVDASASDQGAATTRADRTIKDLVDSIGTSKSATLVLHHSGTGNTTTYTLTTSETIPSNITLRIESGAQIDGAGTLTQNGPFECGLQQCFGSSITVVFGDGATKEVYPDWWGAIANGSTDVSIAVQASADAIGTTGATLFFHNGTWDLETTGLALDSANEGLRIKGENPKKTLLRVSGTASLNCITADLVDYLLIEDIGFDNALTANTGYGVQMKGCKHFTLRNLYASSPRSAIIGLRWGTDSSTWCEDFTIENVRCETSDDAGIYIYKSKYGKVTSPHLYNSQSSHEISIQDSKYISVVAPDIVSDGSSNGITLSDSCDHIEVLGGTIVGAAIGFNSLDTSPIGTNISMRGTLIDSPTTYGIDGDTWTTGIIDGVIIDSAAGSDAMRFQDSTKIKVVNCHILGAGRDGIRLDGCTHFELLHNTVVDVGDGDDNGIYLLDTSTDCLIKDNKIISSADATYQDYGIQLHSTSVDCVVDGNVISGSGTAPMTAGGTANTLIKNVTGADQMNGTFTMDAAATKVITNDNIRTGNVITQILLVPTNAAAATLMGGVKSLYVSARTAATNFTVATADANNAAGTETFYYEILN
jgi:hypothetical protein